MIRYPVTVLGSEAQLHGIPTRPVPVGSPSLDHEKILHGVRGRERPAKGLDRFRLVLAFKHGVGDPGLIL
jgi:hypothetical protein